MNKCIGVVASLDEMDTRLIHPFICIIAGPTGCGKTTFVARLLRYTDSLIDGPPERLMWLYGEWQPMCATLTETIPNVEVVEGLPDPTSFENLVVM